MKLINLAEYKIFLSSKFFINNSFHFIVVIVVVQINHSSSKRSKKTLKTKNTYRNRMKRSWTRIETPVPSSIPPTRESLKHLLPHSNRPPNYSNQHSSLDSIPICCPISLLSIHAGNVTWNVYISARYSLIRKARDFQGKNNVLREHRISR